MGIIYKKIRDCKVKLLIFIISVYNKMNENNSHVYFNIRENYNAETTFDFNANRVDDILENPSEYEMGISRFSIPSIGIPVLFNTPNKYYIRIILDGDTFYRDEVQFPVNTSDPNPLYPPYFGVWSYSEIATGITTSLKTLHDIIKLEQPTFLPTKECSFTFDPITKLFSLYAQDDYGASNIKVQFNHNLFNILNSFQSYSSVTPPDLFPYHQIIIKDNGNNGTTYGGGGYIMTQQYSTLSQMSILDKIVFETNSLPINPELTLSQNNETVIAIDDFYIVRDINDSYTIQFAPVGPILYTDLTSSDPLRRIDIAISWIDNDGNKHKLVGDTNNPLSVKFEFRKKIATRLLDSTDE